MPTTKHFPEATVSYVDAKPAFPNSRKGARAGVTFIDVALASVILMIGVLGTSSFFVNTYEQLSPRGDEGGLRRFLLAEQMLTAQAEGLRVLRVIPVDSVNDLKLVREPVGSKFVLNVQPTIVTNTTLQYVYYDLVVTNSTNVVGRLSMSTLRSAEVSQDEKIGI